MQAGDSRLIPRLLKLLPIAIIGLGILLRLWVYIDNRCLWTDEVNVALNVFEHNFAALTSQLDYGQYAPPIFLWLTKLFTIVFGSGEQALRLYPLITGIGALFLLRSILSKLTKNNTIWYPILVFAFGIFFLRYSTEVKQYMPDAFITLLLIWLTLRTSINTPRFLWIWLAVGSMAIWSSMPSVFILAAIGCYYGSQIVASKNYKRLPTLFVISIIWLTQFLIYYYTILSHQISSDFLVNYHDKYFLTTSLDHNKDLLKSIFENTFGAGDIPLYVNSGLLLIGIVYLFIRHTSKAILFIMPVLLMFMAAALKQYSLIPRLTLFSLPLLLILVGIGLDRLFIYKPILIKLLVTSICVVSFYTTEPFSIFNNPIKAENFTEALDYLKRRNLAPDNIFVYSGAANSYKYYTDYHPDKAQWQTIHGAYLMANNTNTDSIAKNLNSKTALLYTVPFDSYYTKNNFEQYLQPTDTFTTTGCTVFIFGY